MRTNNQVHQDSRIKDHCTISLAFYTLEMIKNKIKKMIIFIIAAKEIKFFGIIFIKKHIIYKVKI